MTEPVTPTELARLMQAALDTIEPHQTRLEELCAEHFIDAQGWNGDDEYSYKTRVSGMRELLDALAAFERLGETYEDVAHRPEVQFIEDAIRITRQEADNT